MKKMLVMCGAGIATSTVVLNKIKQWLEKENLTEKVKLYQGKVGEEINRINDYDIIVSTTIVPENIKDKVINGICLLTNIGIEQFFDNLKQEIIK